MNVQTSNSGLYSGFEGYRSATEDDLIDAVKNSLVVLDTNVLLNLYNFQGTALDDFTKVFDALGDRLFVPHQVMDEFWRNRRTVLAENQGRHREHTTIAKAFEDIQSAFRKWFQRVVDRTNAPPQNAMRELEEARTAILDYMIEQNTEAAATLPDSPTHEDRVLHQLEPILAGSVGPAPARDQVSVLTTEGKARVAAKTPPGYMDGDKNPERAIGDFLVWRQTMDASVERKLAVLMVTQDQKEDWWADRGTKSMRARPELVSELLAASGQALLMIRAHDLVRLGVHLGVAVSRSTLEEAELTSEEIDGWTPELVTTYLEWLEGWPEHFMILEDAAKNGGKISRGEMAAILHKEPEDSMKGIGRPYSTVIRRMVEYGDWATAPDSPLVADYETGGVMSSFVMPANLVSLFKATLAAYEESE